MKKILFVCHGNICRSTMAEYVMKDLVKKEGLSDLFFIDSAATSTEEIGNPVHPGTRRKLHEMRIACGDHRARQITRADLVAFDYLLGMDRANIKNMRRMLGESPKIMQLLDFSSSPRDIADPWYTGDFDATFRDVKEGCLSLLHHMIPKVCREEPNR